MKRMSALLVSAGLVLAACGSEDAVSVSGQWSRASAPTQTRGAVYFDLAVAEDDTLVGASVSSSIAADAQIHEVVMAEDAHGADMSEEMSGDEMSRDEMSDDMDEMSVSEGSGDMDEMDDMDAADGAMVMQEMPNGLALVGGETVSFEPGSYHVMLLDLTDPLDVGEQFEVTLDFATADDVTIDVEVAETAP